LIASGFEQSPGNGEARLRAGKKRASPSKHRPSGIPFYTKKFLQQSPICSHWWQLSAGRSTNRHSRHGPITWFAWLPMAF